MKLVATTSLLDKTLGDLGAIRLLAEAGFDAIDLSLCAFTPDSPWLKPHWRSYAEELKAEAKRLGVTFTQAHAPFPTSKGTEEDEIIFQHVVRAIEVAAVLEIPHIVVHPKQHLPYRQNAGRLFQDTVDFYKALVPVCQRLKVKVCCENMWQRNKKANVIIDSICARAEEFKAVVDAVGSPWVVACLDIGHCGLVHQDPAQAIRVLGHDRLQALHVHDVDLREDRHTLPYTESTDWESVVQALAEIDYDGNFTYEASNFITQFPEPLWPEAAKFMVTVGRYLISRIAYYKEMN